jgi:hypothetical protein
MVSDVLVRVDLLLGSGRDIKFLESKLDAFLTYVIKSLSTLLLSTGLFGLNEQASLLHGLTLLSRESSLVIHYFLVMLRDSLLDFLG